jgi:hypothetical protein
MLKWILIAIVGLGAIGAYVSGNSNYGSRPAYQAPTPPVATIDKSAQMQADRKRLIERLISEGIFQKVEIPGNLPRLWVRPAFHLLDFDRKQSFVSVVYAYYFDGSRVSDTVRLFDSKTGKEVGAYSSGGLRMF